jgi:hypothetical protein
MTKRETCGSVAEAEAMADFCALYDGETGDALGCEDFGIEPAEYRQIVIKSLCTRWDGIVRTVPANKDSRRVYAA